MRVFGPGIVKAALLIPLTLSLLALPSVSAQDDIPPGAITIDMPAPSGFLPPETTTNLPTNVTVACTVIIGTQSPSLALALADDAPDYLSSAGATVTFAATDCAGSTSGSVTKSVDFPVTPSAEAPGLTPFSFGVVGTIGERTAEETVEGVRIDYMPGHTFDPAGDQTFEVDGDAYMFNLTITIMANAVTMVMFENVDTSAGTIEGLAVPRTFQVPDNDTVEVRQITYRPPSGAWTNATVTFYTYSHCLDGPDCPPTGEENITWTFVNASPPPTGGGEDDEKDSPGPALPLVLAVLVAFAARRRRA